MSYPPGPYTPDPAYNQPPEGGFTPPPKKSKKGLIITLSVIGGLLAVLCCGGVIAGVVIYQPFGKSTAAQPVPAQNPNNPPPSAGSLPTTGSTSGTGDTGSGGASSAREAADKYMTAVKNKDDNAANAVTCPALQNGTPAGAPPGLDPSDVQLKKFSYTIASDTPTSATHHDVVANANLTLTVSGEDNDVSGEYKLGVDKGSGGWKVCSAAFTSPELTG
ncbi:hypothetical protein [Fodinicola feengrottensis]|uniref:Uncharacterized protein n=1 Tax=Fodinicola feengrottensis TaxID=435914 RepID=A0ABN2I5U0_9ACTN|nr:hypothetical protein [Fodinicola feengrottensis]